MLRTHRRISILVTICCAIIAVPFFKYAYQAVSLNKIAKILIFYKQYICFCLFIFSAFFKHKFTCIFQVGFLYSMSVLYILNPCCSFYGIGLYFLSFILASKYKFFDKYSMQKAILSTLIIFFLLAFNLFKNGISSIIDQGLFGFNILIYLLMFIVTIWIIYKNEINNYIEKANNKDETIFLLQSDRKNLKSMIYTLNERIDALENEYQPINYNLFGITDREQQVIERAVVYKENAKEIAKSLNISYWTVNEHFRHIRDKLGVDNREGIVRMCQNNYHDYII